jgi:hypothetical protein
MGSSAEIPALMLQRLVRSPAARRARAYRARRRAGVRHDLKVRTHTRRLVAALRAAAQAAGRPVLATDDPTRTEIERELTAIVEAFVSRWIGAEK